MYYTWFLINVSFFSLNNFTLEMSGRFHRSVLIHLGIHGSISLYVASLETKGFLGLLTSVIKLSLLHDPFHDKNPQLTNAVELK